MLNLEENIKQLVTRELLEHNKPKDLEASFEEIIMNNTTTGERRKYSIPRYFSCEEEKYESVKLIEYLMKDTLAIFKGHKQSDNLSFILDYYKNAMQTEKDLNLHIKIHIPNRPETTLKNTKENWMIGEQLFPHNDWYVSFQQTNLIHILREKAFRLLSLKIMLTRLKNKQYTTLNDVWENLVSAYLKEQIIPLLFEIKESCGEHQHFYKMIENMGSKLDLVKRYFKGDTNEIVQAPFTFYTYAIALEGEVSPLDVKNLRYYCGSGNANKEYAEQSLKRGGIMGPSEVYRFLSIEQDTNGRHYIQMEEVAESQYNFLQNDLAAEKAHEDSNKAFITKSSVVQKL